MLLALATLLTPVSWLRSTTAITPPPDPVDPTDPVDPVDPTDPTDPPGPNWPDWYKPVYAPVLARPYSVTTASISAVLRRPSTPIVTTAMISAVVR